MPARGTGLRAGHWLIQVLRRFSCLPVVWLLSSGASHTWSDVVAVLVLLGTGPESSQWSQADDMLFD